MIEVIDCVQGSPEWRQARAGRVTGSGAACVMAKPDTASYQDYLLKLAVERMTGVPQQDDFSSRHTRRGSEMEPLARVMVELKHGVLIQQCGFVIPESRMDMGFSPDGYVGRFERLVEIKCPKSTTHVGYMKGGKLPAEYRWQVIHGMHVTMAKSCIFASFDDRMPPGLRLFTIEVTRADVEDDFLKYTDTLDRFLEQVDKKVIELDGLK